MRAPARVDSRSFLLSSPGSLAMLLAMRRASSNRQHLGRVRLRLRLAGIDVSEP
jgi:hypothetical protein